ncbi:Rne/Rng family ribonuclease [Salinisphaera sp. SPP-AMP-43]|uniref:Rne/Rng family ribonuclease n=1 Tax=Salinisphaera sp. SPP-AMP-43 TaxID=3121288 RepID=UPI003C6E9CDA
MKRILINATQPEELRVAIVDGQKLHDLDIEVGSREQRKANVYKGRVTRVEPSLEAAFIDYGGNRHGFLPLKEVAKSYYANTKGDDSGKDNGKPTLSEGQEVIVQVEKEERGNKGAALTTYISLAGRYLVLMPNNPKAGGVSRRIEGEERNELREALNQVEVPSGMGVIVRTAGVGRCAEELQWDLDYLAHVWQAINEAAAERKAPFLVYQESNVIIRALRDYLRDDIGEVLIDQPDVYETGREFMQQVMPNSLHKLKQYTDDTPLFSRFQVESQIESAFEREVTLPSGGSVVIDHTEAMTSVDINSARATKGASIEETAFNTNVEAAEEIARQLRIRDLGGLVVIDFIDMDNAKNQREVENRLKQAAKADRARVQIGRISRFGLLEMSRQRLKPSLSEYSSHVCPRCLGRGSIRSVESLSLSILRLLEEEAMKPGTGRVIVQLPIPVASFLLNEKRSDLADVETRAKTRITLVPNNDLETPHYEIKRVRGDQLEEEDNNAASYKIDTEVDIEKPAEPDRQTTSRNDREEPAVKRVARSDAPVIDRGQNDGQEQHAQSSDPAMTPWQQLWDALRRIFSGEAEFGFGSTGPASREATQQKTADDQQRSAKSNGQSKTDSSDSRSAQNKDDGDRSPTSSDGKSSGGSNGRSGRNRRRGGRNRNRSRSEDSDYAETSANNRAKAEARLSAKTSSDDSSNDKSSDSDNSSKKNDGGSKNQRKTKASKGDDSKAKKHDRQPTAEADNTGDDNKAKDSDEAKAATNKAKDAETKDQAATATEGAGNSHTPAAEGDDTEEPKRNRRRRRGGRGRRGGRRRNNADNEAQTEDQTGSEDAEQQSTTAALEESANSESDHTPKSEPQPADAATAAESDDDQAPTPKSAEAEAQANDDSDGNSSDQSSQRKLPDIEDKPWSAVTASDNARSASEKANRGQPEKPAIASDAEDRDTGQAAAADSTAKSNDSQAADTADKTEAAEQSKTKSKRRASGQSGQSSASKKTKAKSPSADDNASTPAAAEATGDQDSSAQDQAEADSTAQPTTVGPNQSASTDHEPADTSAESKAPAETTAKSEEPETGDRSSIEDKPSQKASDAGTADGDESADTPAAATSKPRKTKPRRSRSKSSKAKTEAAENATRDDASPTPAEPAEAAESTPAEVAAPSASAPTEDAPKAPAEGNDTSVAEPTPATEAEAEAGDDKQLQQVETSAPANHQSDSDDQAVDQGAEDPSDDHAEQTAQAEPAAPVAKAQPRAEASSVVESTDSDASQLIQVETTTGSSDESRASGNGQAKASEPAADTEDDSGTAAETDAAEHKQPKADDDSAGSERSGS